MNEAKSEAKEAKAGRVGNLRFQALLREHCGMTYGELAQAVGCTRPRLSEAVNFKPDRGGHIRPKVIRFLRSQWPAHAEPLVRALEGPARGDARPTMQEVTARGDARPTVGNQGFTIPNGTLHVEHEGENG